jgi:hypothetical protein
MLRSFAVFALSALLSCPQLWAKGDLVIIKINGRSLAAPIEITDPKIQEFNPWAGPGTFTFTNNTPNAEGFVIDWHAGVVNTQHPLGLQHYQVSFYAGCRTRTDPRCLSEKPRLVYFVYYEYDPSLPRGFIYIPGKGSPFYYVNMGSIARGCEGNWFIASNSWERFVRPVIAAGRR